MQENARSAANVPASPVIQKPQPASESTVPRDAAEPAVPLNIQDSIASPAAEATEVTEEAETESEDKGLSKSCCNVLLTETVKLMHYYVHHADSMSCCMQSQMQEMVQIWTTTAGLKRCLRLHYWCQSPRAPRAKCVML